MKCRECGAEINDSAKFCEHCGARVINDASENEAAEIIRDDGEFSLPLRNSPKNNVTKSQDTDKDIRGNSSEYSRNNRTEQNNNNKTTRQNEEGTGSRKSNTAVIVLLCILIGIAIFVAAAVAAYMFVDDQPSVLKESLENHGNGAITTMVPSTPSPTPKVDATKKPQVSAEPTKKPSYTSQTNENVHISEPTYKVYSDSEMGFSSAYPTHFEKYSDGTSEGRYTLKNSDGSVTLRICAEDNDAGITLEQSLSMFKSKNSGDIEYTKVGNTYYAVRINVLGICRYRYLISKNNKMYWFDFSYPEEYRDIYENYIDHIYRSFTIR